MQIQAGKNWYQTRPSDRPDKTSPVSLRLGAEYSYNFNAVHKPRAQLFLDTYTRFGFESSWTVFNRKPNSDETNPLTIGDGNLTFRFAQNRHVQFYAGIGSRILIDHGNATFGANFTYGIDIFPVKPIVISLVVDIGNVAEVFVTEAGATVGVILNNWEIYGGYNTLAIDNDRFQGPLLGVRKWF